MRASELKSFPLFIWLISNQNIRSQPCNFRWLSFVYFQIYYPRAFCTGIWNDLIAESCSQYVAKALNSTISGALSLDLGRGVSFSSDHTGPWIQLFRFTHPCNIKKSFLRWLSNKLQHDGIHLELILTITALHS